MLHTLSILENEWGIYVCNAPSPVATSSLNIGGLIADRVLSKYTLLRLN